ncbi:MFS transporter [Actinosynnema sp. ALI-1.44]|uniref:MFS transporter n=1 Tax=Actinosynnema sp. ALI-1.44 TaxID=1933779 RepID=UPI00097C6625|nr:MFS transporter [Actinosynnema sp. ALI-1.44]ONI83124.1 MFS transporter [Actinosynnema sp. ALI-1.44]
MVDTRVTNTTPVAAVVIFLLALNLRPAVTSLGASLPDVPVAHGSTAAVLVALPLWAIGVGGWMTSFFTARWGVHRTVTLALGTLVVALLSRVLGDAALLLTGTALACLAIAVVGTLIPVLADGSPRRFSLCYTLALGLGSTVGALVTPLIVNTWSWQVGLAAWAAIAVFTVRIWRRTSPVFANPGPRPVRPWSLVRSAAARNLTLYFGLISSVTFLVMGWFPAILRDAGLSPEVAGSCLALAMAMGLPMMWLVPQWVHQWHNQTALVVCLTLPTMAGVTGLLVAPAFAPWAYAIGVGIGLGSLAAALAAIPMRAGSDVDLTTALSALVQGAGYLIAGVGALVCGLLHSSTGTWRGPLVLVLGLLCGQIVAGARALRPVLVTAANATPSRSA